MFDSIKGMAEQAMSGNVDQQALGQAVGSHLDSVDDGQLADHMQTAGNNLQQQGQGDLAQQAMALAEQVRSDPSQARGGIVSFVQNNPQVLEHFAPQFAQGILSKVGL